MSNKHVVYDINGEAHLITHPVDVIGMIESGRFFTSPPVKGKKPSAASLADVKVVDEDGKEVKSEFIGKTDEAGESEPDKKPENGSKKGLKKRIINDKED